MKGPTFILLALVFFSCHKESFTSNPDFRVTIFADTVRFDTVFTATGSVTQSFKIFNNNTKGIELSSVTLKGGNTSPFKINVNGVTGPQVNNIAIGGGDSAYVFVTVNVNPNTSTLPFVLRDSIEIAYNGNTERIQLEAYGQNAHFFRNRVIDSDEVWEAGLPYVILGGLIVAPNTQLTIKEGCRIYVHADAPFIVEGTLAIEGKKWDSTRVVFTGARLDEPYKDYPASWPGIFFTEESKDNTIEFAVIKNAFQAVVVEEPSDNVNPKLKISETIIDNAFDAGLVAVNSSIYAQNLLVSNCGKNIILLNGGTYEFVHCTAASVSNGFILHTEPVLQVSNYLEQSGTVSTNPLHAVFRNCIFWGEGGAVENEVVVLKKGNEAFDVQFDHVLWKVKTEPAGVSITTAITEPPAFETIDAEKRVYNFRLTRSSAALDKGVNTNAGLDLDGNSRPADRPDLGCYEKQ